jgi:hypothetical protein
MTQFWQFFPLEPLSQHQQRPFLGHKNQESQQFSQPFLFNL